MAPADPDKPCPHEDFEVWANVGRIKDGDDGPVVRYTCDVRVNCVQCGERFRWVGLPAGLSAAHPTVDVEEFELRAPIRPASADPDFGLGIPGFAIQVRE